jgi:hypothetical protein
VSDGAGSRFGTADQRVIKAGVCLSACSRLSQTAACRADPQAVARGDRSHPARNNSLTVTACFFDALRRLQARSRFPGFRRSVRWLCFLGLLAVGTLAILPCDEIGEEPKPTTVDDDRLWKLTIVTQTPPQPHIASAPVSDARLPRRQEAVTCV